ncbi:MAG: DMT family transporter [Kiritimatiellaeota bacterium]|nr:DMT family transporter [Kiritimatiellota bacterium]
MGIALGLLAAFFQSLSYLCSRHFLKKHQGESLKLLVLSHIAMGIASFIILPFLWDSSAPEFSVYVFPLICCSLFYFVGQTLFVLALKQTEASRLSPLLGLKVCFIAFISISFLDASYSPLQWIAVAATVSAGVLLNWSGKPPPLKSLVFILGACLCYSISDINIKLLVNTLNLDSMYQGTLLSVCMTYCLCGALSAPVWAFTFKKSDARLAVDALPFAGVWYLSMFALFSCFGMISVLLGNIVQSTRGIISILVAFAVAAMGYEHLERKIPGSLFARRIFAAVLMLAAIILFSYG